MRLGLDISLVLKVIEKLYLPHHSFWALMKPGAENWSYGKCLQKLLERNKGEEYAKATAVATIETITKLVKQF